MSYHIQHLRRLAVSFILQATTTQAEPLAFLAALALHHLTTITP